MSVQNRYYNVGFIWNYGYGGTYKLYLDQLGIQMDQKFRDKLDKIDDRKRTYNTKKYSLKIVFQNIDVLS